MSGKIQVILVEDDTDLGRMLKLFLEMDEFQVAIADSAETAIKILDKKTFDIGIVDVNLPGLSGFDLAEKIRDLTHPFPYLFLTAKTLQVDRIKGLRIGADDYITKPFDAEELILRIKNILKRSHEPFTQEIQFGDFILSLSKLQLIHRNGIQQLTRREAELLSYLLRYKNTLVQTKNILTELWGEDNYFLGRSMNVFISRLRKYLAYDPRIIIRNVRAEGYELQIRDS